MVFNLNQVVLPIIGLREPQTLYLRYYSSDHNDKEHDDFQLSLLGVVTEETQEEETTQEGISDEERKKLEDAKAQIEAILNPVSAEEAAEALVTKRDARMDQLLALLEKSGSEETEETEGSSEEKPKGEVATTLDELAGTMKDISTRLAIVQKSTTGKQGLEEIDLEKLTDYAIKTGNNAVIKRLGFIIDFLGLDSMDMENKISGSYSILDPTKGKNGRYNSKWKLLINVSERELKW